MNSSNITQNSFLEPSRWTFVVLEKAQKLYVWNIFLFKRHAVNCKNGERLLEKRDQKQPLPLNL